MDDVKNPPKIEVYEPENLTQEKKLLIAMIDTAVRDIVAYNHRPSMKNRALMLEAAAFFEDDEIQPFSFLWSMQVLGADPKIFYKKLAVFVRQKRNYGRKKDL